MDDKTESAEGGVNTPSAYEARTRERVDNLALRFEDHDKELGGNIDKMWKVLEKIRDRPPTWVSWVMTAGGTTIGAMAMKLLG